MPAENHSSDSDCSSLTLNWEWEDFFGASNTDLLPCLLSVYDSIAAARKLEDNDLLADKTESQTQMGTEQKLLDSRSHSIADSSDQVDLLSKVPGTGTDHVYARYPPFQVERGPPNSASELWYDIGLPQASVCSSRSHTRSSDYVNAKCSPCGAYVSSTSSVCSSGSGDSMKHCTNGDLNEHSVNHQPNIAISKYLDNLVVDDTEGQKDVVNLLEPQPRTSYTTASQYSEDSGIYSSLVRSQSLQERSWFYADGEDVSYMNRVINEILESELVYVNDLQQIIMGYLDEWRNDDSCPLSAEQINDLFGNIEEIYHFNRCFFWELEQCGLDSVKIARCFVENNSNFSIYAVYCTHYPKSISILTELMRQEKTAHIFRERQISLHHTLPLGSYLLKPVQRILKYHLLLQNMVKHASPHMTGYNDITVALSTMTGIAHHINTMKRRHEHAVRVQEVQSLLTGWQGPDLTTFGELYAEGSFRISGAKASRHIFLFEHMLLVTKKKEAAILNYKTHILCSNLMLVECIPKEPLSFQIIPFDNPRMQFSIHARSLEEKRHWTLELKRVILENYSVDIPSHARQLVMELGQTQDSADMTIEKMSYFKRQHSIPEYLQKRKLHKEKRLGVKSRILPLFWKPDSLQSYKVRSKLKKHYFLSENSIFSDASVNSDESSSLNDDSGLQTFSQTTEDLSETCDKMTRTLEGLSRSSAATTSSADERTVNDTTASSISSPEPDEPTSYQQKEKLIEEIIGQLLIASQKFQRAIKEHERSVRSKRFSASQQVQSDVEDEETDYDSFSEHESTSVLKYAKENDEDDDDDYVSSKDTSTLDTSTESLSASLRELIPTPPMVWLAEQRQHLATPPHKKADSLPRTFQLPEEEWRSIRPKTIASDKPSRMKDMRLFDHEDAHLTMSKHGLFGRRKELLMWTPSWSSTATTHPDCKFYSTSIVRMTFRRMVHTIGVKLSLKRAGKSEQFYKVEHQFEGAKCHASPAASTHETTPTAAIYRQGSSDLGARIANGKHVPDYADPRVLFPTITPSKKAASLLGIRPASATSHTTLSLPANALLPAQSSNDATPLAVVHNKAGSDCSADSFYERQFEQVESEFDNATRETSILRDKVKHDYDDDKGSECQCESEKSTIGQSFPKYSHLNVNISVHKIIKIPPPVPMRPTMCRSNSSSNIERTKPPTLARRRTQPFTHTSTIKEVAVPSQGWVKQVVDKFQSFE